MIEGVQLSSIDIATLSAIVAALVTVIGNSLGIPKRYRAILAIALSFAFVLIPAQWSEKVIAALVIGLTASGLYSQVKPRQIFRKEKKKEGTGTKVQKDKREETNE